MATFECEDEFVFFKMLNQYKSAETKIPAERMIKVFDFIIKNTDVTSINALSKSLKLGNDTYKTWKHGSSKFISFSVLIKFSIYLNIPLHEIDEFWWEKNDDLFISKLSDYLYKLDRKQFLIDNLIDEKDNLQEELEETKFLLSMENKEEQMPQINKYSNCETCATYCTVVDSEQDREINDFLDLDISKEQPESYWYLCQYFNGETYISLLDLKVDEDNRYSVELRSYKLKYFHHVVGNGFVNYYSKASQIHFNIIVYDGIPEEPVLNFDKAGNELPYRFGIGSGFATKSPKQPISIPVLLLKRNPRIIGIDKKTNRPVHDFEIYKKESQQLQEHVNKVFYEYSKYIHEQKVNENKDFDHIDIYKKELFYTLNYDDFDEFFNKQEEYNEIFKIAKKV